MRSTLRLLVLTLLPSCGDEPPMSATADARPPITGSDLLDVVAQMQPGDWAELSTDDIGAALLGTGGSSGFIFGYAESMRWDPMSRRAFYLGSDHGGDDSYRFVAFDEATNAWVRLPQPPWSVVPAGAPEGTYNDAHGYDQLAIDPPGRRLFRRPYNGNRVHVYHLDEGTWSALPDPPFAGEYGSCCDAIEYFAELGGLVWSRGHDAVWLFEDASGQWTPLADALGLTGTWLFAELDPVHHAMILGHGGGALYQLDAQGTMSARDPLSITIYDGSAWNGVFTVDPVSGEYLVLTASNHELHVYDAQGDRWALAAQQPPSTADGAVVAAPLDTHGVTMFTHCRSGECGVLLYRHAPAF
jgi:hypothetical protein